MSDEGVIDKPPEIDIELVIWPPRTVDRYNTHDKNEPQVLHTRPFQGVLILFVCRVLPCRSVIRNACAWKDFLLDEYVFNEAIYDTALHRCIRLRPENDPRARQYFETVQHDQKPCQKRSGNSTLRRIAG